MSRRKHQNGFVKPTGKKRRTWTGYWYEYVEADAGSRRKEHSKVLGLRSEMTKGEAQDALRETIRRGNVLTAPQPAVASAEMAFSEAIESYKKVKSPYWSRHNEQNMNSLFRASLLPELGSRKVADLKATEIKLFIGRLTQRGASQSEIHKCLTHIRAIFELLVDDDILPKNPARKIREPKSQKKADESFLALEDCRRLLKAADGITYMVLRLTMASALRPSELFALRLRDVEPGKIRIEKAVVKGYLKDTKTKSSEGHVPISGVLYQELIEYADREGIGPNDFLFASETGTPYERNNFRNRKLKPLADSLGIQVEFRKLRRTVATHFQNHGRVKDAQALLRHASASVTLKHYQKTLDENLSQAVGSWDAELAKREIVQ